MRKKKALPLYFAGTRKQQRKGNQSIMNHGSYLSFQVEELINRQKKEPSLDTRELKSGMARAFKTIDWETSMFYYLYKWSKIV
ncbi:MAG: hypothetical protein PWP41_12 [Moorella sp. (in: firmicutes)]|nr:hypothetical protein [Moorella sp. (in: firmicutes)]